MSHKLRKRRDVKEFEEAIMKGLKNSQAPESCDVTILKSMFYKTIELVDTHSLLQYNKIPYALFKLSYRRRIEYFAVELHL